MRFDECAPGHRTRGGCRKVRRFRLSRNNRVPGGIDGDGDALIVEAAAEDSGDEGAAPRCLIQLADDRVVVGGIPPPNDCVHPATNAWCRCRWRRWWPGPDVGGEGCASAASNFMRKPSPATLPIKACAPGARARYRRTCARSRTRFRSRLRRRRPDRSGRLRRRTSRR